MFTVEGDQVKVEGGSPLVFGVLKSDLEVGRILIGLQGDRVVIVGQLHDFR
jgi:hypothetical protein